VSARHGRTLDRIGVVIERLTGVRHHPAWVWALLRHRLGWSVQRPVRRAAEREPDWDVIDQHAQHLRRGW
jgi:transposase